MARRELCATCLRRASVMLSRARAAPTHSTTFLPSCPPTPHPTHAQVIDAEILRRKMLEATPIASRNEDPVNWDTSEIPAWAWIKRFHLPEVRR
eukprot:365176-Chlamydomonas_euryale.AAC.3